MLGHVLVISIWIVRLALIWLIAINWNGSDWLQKKKTNKQSARGTGGNKLRNYKLFKTSWEPEQFCRIIMPQSHRSAFPKFRSGVAPLRIETGRYEDLRITEILCPFCRDLPKTNFMFCLNVHSITSLEKYFSEMPAHMTNLFIPMMKPLKSHFCSAIPIWYVCVPKPAF